MFTRRFRRNISWSLSSIIAVAAFVAAAPVNPPAAEKSPQKHFDFQITRGQYILIAFGKTDKKNVKPLLRFACQGDYNLKITANPSASEGGERFWRFEERIQRIKPLNDIVIWSGVTLQDSALERSKIEEISPVLQDISKQTSFSGIQIYRIPYARVDGGTRYLLLAISDKLEIFPLLFSLPQTEVYSKFDWKKWTVYK